MAKIRFSSVNMLYLLKNKPENNFSEKNKFNSNYFCGITFSNCLSDF